MFDDAWRCMKYRFYDPKLHGTDWDAMRAKYKPLVAFVADRQELMNVINEMIGELNASHTGASAGRSRPARRGEGRAGHDAAPRPRPPGRMRPAAVTRSAHVYEDGPADKDWIKVAKGNYLIAIDGKPIKAGDDYFAFLGRRLNRKVELTLNDKPVPEGAWKVKYEPISDDGLQQPPLRALGEGAASDGGQALGRPGRLSAHPGDGSTLAGEVQEGARRSSATRRAW